MKTWKVISIDCSNLDGKQQVVRQVSLKIVRSEGLHECEIHTGVSLPLPQGSGFLPYTSLDEATIIAWAKTALGDDKVKELENVLDAQFAPPENADIVNTPLPWVDDSNSPTFGKG